MSFVIYNGILRKYVPETDKYDIVIPDDVVEIGYEVFKNSNIRSVTIPSGVRTIGASEFEHCSGLRKVTLSNGLENIEDNAFYGCSGLEYIEIPDTVKKLGASVFKFCMNMKSISLPEKVENIDTSIFFGCSELESINVSEKNKVYTSVDGVLFSKDMKTLIFYPCARKNSCYTIPDGVETIQKTAFNFCGNLESIVIPDSMKRIERLAFSRCPELKHITISSRKMVIDDSAFSNMPDFSCITIRGRKTSLKIFRDFFEQDVYSGTGFFRYVTAPLYMKEIDFLEIENPGHKLLLSIFLAIESNYMDAKMYLMVNFRDAVKYLIDIDDAENLAKFLALGYVNKKNVDIFIAYAIQRKKPEILLTLIKHRHDCSGFDSEDSFDKFML